MSNRYERVKDTVTNPWMYGTVAGVVAPLLIIGAAARFRPNCLARVVGAVSNVAAARPAVTASIFVLAAAVLCIALCRVYCDEKKLSKLRLLDESIPLSNGYFVEFASLNQKIEAKQVASAIKLKGIAELIGNSSVHI